MTMSMDQVEQALNIIEATRPLPRLKAIHDSLMLALEEWAVEVEKELATKREEAAKAAAAAAAEAVKQAAIKKAADEKAAEPAPKAFKSYEAQDDNTGNGSRRL